MTGLRFLWRTGIGCVVALASAPVAAADVLSHIDAARGYQQKGDIAHAAHELEMALLDLQDRLGRSLSALMPAAAAGWTAEEAEYEGLESSGGGLSVTRAYTKNDASLNASLILDNPAVETAMQQPGGASAVKKLKIGTEDALLRWDQGSHSGDITLVLGRRVMIQITADSIDTADTLIDLAKSFDLAQIRKVVGL